MVGVWFCLLVFCVKRLPVFVFLGWAIRPTPVYTVTTLDLEWVCAMVHAWCHLTQQAWGIRTETRQDFLDISRFRVSLWQICAEAVVREYSTSLAVRSQYPWSYWSDCFKLDSQLFSINFLVASTLGCCHPESRKEEGSFYCLGNAHDCLHEPWSLTFHTR
jgi:hypothetical protein